MDIEMPGCDGLAATRLIQAERPDVKIVMLTMSSEDEDLFEAIQSGASGYLLKTLDTEQFFAALIQVEQGEVPLSPGLAARILQHFGQQASAVPASAVLAAEDRTQGEPLTGREVEVLTLVAQGLTYKEVGARLHLSERTIKYHMGEMVARLHVENRAQVIEAARQAGIV
jgi:two-component system NarL family response regulator